MYRALMAMTMTAVAAPAAAHDFWVQPRSFVMPAPAVVPFTILVGHGQFRQRWAAPVERVDALRTFGPDGTADHRADLHPGNGPDDGVLRFQKPGTYLIVLQTNDAKSDLPALRFNTYLKDEGITPALQYRQANGQMQADGREAYSRRAKSLVQIGPLDVAGSPQVTRPIGLTLEIVPERNPYALRPKDPLALRILYYGKPLPGAFVKLTNLDFDAVPVETHVSDAEGRVVFAAPPRGAWQFNVIWTRPVKDIPDADFQTVFSSLTIGVPPRPLAQ